jgi:hypothetical protein
VRCGGDATTAVGAGSWTEDSEASRGPWQRWREVVTKVTRNAERPHVPRLGNFVPKRGTDVGRPLGRGWIATQSCSGSLTEGIEKMGELQLFVLEPAVADAHRHRCRVVILVLSTKAADATSSPPTSDAAATRHHFGLPRSLELDVGMDQHP